MPSDTIRAFTELSQFELHTDSIRLLPQEFCQRNGVVVLGKLDFQAPGVVHVGMIDPTDTAIIKWLEMRWARRVEPVALNLYEVDRVLQQGFGTQAHATYETDRVLDLQRAEPDPRADIANLVNATLVKAVKVAATDVHIESYREDVDVRFRLDGVLHQVQTHISPANLMGAVNRIKVLAGMDISERRRPQDGRIRFKVIDGEIKRKADFRVSTLPGPHGEDVVIRLLGGTTGLLSLDQLGMPDSARTSLLDLLRNPEGLVLVTGPTGCGKTTTLYAALDHLNDGKRKILTAEDPIEIELEKVNQKQVSAHLDFATLARTFLRQDPDVMLIGEVRDEETAQIAVRAATTGHVVLSTLHTTDSFGAISRLEALGIESAQLGEAVLGVLAQRLIRLLCLDCAQNTPVTDEQRAQLGPLLSTVDYRTGPGCEHCHGTGYRGRTGIYELLVLDNELQDRVCRQDPLNRIRQDVLASGFRNLLQSALFKAEKGLTSLEEVLRVLPYRYIAAAVAEVPK